MPDHVFKKPAASANKTHEQPHANQNTGTGKHYAGNTGALHPFVTPGHHLPKPRQAAKPQQVNTMRAAKKAAAPFTKLHCDKSGGGG